MFASGSTWLFTVHHPLRRKGNQVRALRTEEYKIRYKVWAPNRAELRGDGGMPGFQWVDLKLSASAYGLDHPDPLLLGRRTVPSCLMIDLMPCPNAAQPYVPEICLMRMVLPVGILHIPSVLYREYSGLRTAPAPCPSTALTTTIAAELWLCS